MKRVVGLWIDHRKAVIVAIGGEGKEIILTMKSHMEPHVRFAGGSRSKAAHQSLEVTAEDQRDRRFADHLNAYYDEVISQFREAEAILVFGPGEAMGELEKRLQDKGLGSRIVGVETVDKMTDGQIAATVRQPFLEEGLPIWLTADVRSPGDRLVASRPISRPMDLTSGALRPRTHQPPPRQSAERTYQTAVRQASKSARFT